MTSTEVIQKLHHRCSIPIYNFGTLYLPNQFSCLLSRVSVPMRAERDIVMADLSYRLSVTLWYCIETNTHSLLWRIWL